MYVPNVKNMKIMRQYKLGAIHIVRRNKSILYDLITTRGLKLFL